MFCKNSNKRARNTKLVSVFFTASAENFRVFSKIVTNEQEIRNLFRYFLQRVQKIFEFASKTVTNGRNFKQL